jgi:4-amino-4-deoxy-L-arabinose transferase and related glycosyltransferases of PMT family
VTERADRRWRSHLAAGAVIFVLSSAFAITLGWDVPDDSWLLHVSDRIASGETLYRDVFFHVTPLSAYVLALFTRLFGAEMIVLKLAVAAGFTGIALLTCRIDHQLGGRRRYSPLLLLSLFVFASTARLVLVMFYTLLPTFFLMAAFTLWLSWRARRDDRLLFATGLAVGLCFVSKQNVGVFCAAAVTAATLAAGWADKREVGWITAMLARVATAGAIVTAFALLPVVLSGGLPGLIDFGFTGTAVRRAEGGMWYYKPIFSLPVFLVRPFSLTALRALNAAAPYFFGPLLAPMLVEAFQRGTRKDRELSLAVGAFAAAGMAVMYPRADQQHMIFAAPALLVAMGFCWRQLDAGRSLTGARVLHGAVLACVCGAFAFLVVSAGLRVSSPDYVWSDLPHFRGLLMKSDDYSALASRVRQLALLPKDGGTLLVSPNAGFYYLAVGLHNPTRFDYLSSVTLGSRGSEEVISAIRTGRVKRVCVDHDTFPGERPRTIERFVTQSMTRASDAGFCILYVFPLRKATG